MRILLSMVAVLATILSVSASNASIVVNGGFDAYTNPLANGYYQHVANGTAVGGAGTILEGWGVGFGPLANASNSGVDLVNNTGPLSPADSSPNFVDLNGTPGPGNIFQVLNTVANQSYVLSFKYTANSVPAIGLFGVWDGDESLTGAALVAPNPGPFSDPTPSNPLVWDSYSVVFTALSNQTLIGFGQFAPASGNQGAMIDSVVVEAVPEPTTLLVWGGLALAGLTVLKRRSAR